MTSPATVQIRRQVIADWLREHPLSTAREICDGLLNETGGTPAFFTGAVYISAWTAYADLRLLDRRGEVEGWRIANLVYDIEVLPADEQESDG